MRILVMADMPPDPDSGAAGSEYQLIAALRALGHHVDVLWTDDIGPRRIAHGNLHYLLELPRSYRAALRRVMKSASYDVVHVNQPHGWMAAEWLRRHHPGVPFVHRSHGLELRVERDLAPWRTRYESDKRPWYRRAAGGFISALLARHSHRIVRSAGGHIVFVSEDRDFLVSELGVASERIAVIAAAAPAPMIETPAPPMMAERLRTILYVSQFAFFKAPNIVAKAMSELAGRHGDLRFVWLCDAQHHHAVRALFAPEVLRRLELLPWTSQEELRAVYDRAGIFLFPSFFEGFGKVFLEAMARGDAVVATNIAGARDVIEDGRDGILVPVGDVTALVSAVESLLADPARAATISESAAAKARTYTWRRAASEAAAFYERLRGLGPVRR